MVCLALCYSNQLCYFLQLCWLLGRLLATWVRTAWCRGHARSASIAVAGLAVGHRRLPSMCPIRRLAQAWQVGRLPLLAVD